MPYTITHEVDGGIERISYIPTVRRFVTPIVMQHGMWHGAWCWQAWQALLAEWGWESHAHSLPGHGRSPVQRPIRWCTLQYYFEFLHDEIRRQRQPPILLGHSMGGALTQWYLKYGGPLAAAVLVAPWTSHNMQDPALVRPIVLRDPLGILLCLLTLTATLLVRNPRRAAECFITEGAIISPVELHARLGPESAWVLGQYQPPFWEPVAHTDTPMLWLAGERDAVLPEWAERRSAAHYGADYVVIPGAGHNLMMERSYHETAEQIHQWLAGRQIAVD